MQVPNLEIAELKRHLAQLQSTYNELEQQLELANCTTQKLRQSEEQFRMLVTNVRDYAIFMLDTNGCIVNWNTGAQLIKGYTPEEIIGQHFSIFYPISDITARKPERELEIAAAEGVYSEEGWRLRKDGSLFWASVVITALYDEHQQLRGYGKVTRDLTERKLAEDTQKQLQEQELLIIREQTARAHAEENVRLRDRFLGITAHELRTPVTSVLGYAQLLERRLSQQELTRERLERPVHAIATQAKRLELLTTMLLDITRIEHGKLTLIPTTFDLRESVERIVQELQLLSDDHTILSLLPSQPLILTGDAIRLEQVLYNLVQNGIKYSPFGGTIRITAWQEHEQFIITVSDQGLGIPASDLPHIFERFYRATNISGNQISGLGLGLYLAKEFVTLHSGTISATSEVGAGATFTIRIPSTPPV